MCNALSDIDGYKLIIACCLHYVTINNSIVTQALGVLSGTLAASMNNQDHSSIFVPFCFYIDNLISGLLNNDISRLLVVLLDKYRDDERIVFQVVASLSILSYSSEGITFLKNTPHLVDHLKSILNVRTNMKQRNNLVMVILKKLGCVISSIVSLTNVFSF